MTRFCNIISSDPGMLPMYLITGTCYSEGKIKWNEIVHHFYIRFTQRDYLDCF